MWQRSTRSISGPASNDAPGPSRASGAAVGHRQRHGQRWLGGQRRGQQPRARRLAAQSPVGERGLRGRASLDNNSAASLVDPTSHGRRTLHGHGPQLNHPHRAFYIGLGILACIHRIRSTPVTWPPPAARVRCPFVFAAAPMDRLPRKPATVGNKSAPRRNESLISPGAHQLGFRLLRLELGRLPPILSTAISRSAETLKHHSTVLSHARPGPWPSSHSSPNPSPLSQPLFPQICGLECFACSLPLALRLSYAGPAAPTKRPLAVVPRQPVIL